MAVDILIFAVIAAALAFKLHSVLGTRHGDERPRQNPFDAANDVAGVEAETEMAERPSAPVIEGAARALPEDLSAFIHPDHNSDGRIETGLAEIIAADPRFHVAHFLQGARMAFEMVVTAFAAGDRAALRPLLSPRLYADFDAAIAAREAAGHKSSVTIERFRSARIAGAHLGGTMAYVTVDFDVEETAVTRDADGNIVDGDPDKLFSVEDIWTFTRDVRSADPNWTLVETRTVEKE